MSETASKIVTSAVAAQRASALRSSGQRLITVNGIFDLLHAGHVAILEEAKAQGDALFVGMNSDASVRRSKGPNRPIVPERERARMLAALGCVDYVVIIEETEAGAATLSLIRPHVHVNGSEYGPPERWVEYQAMQTYGVTGYVCTRRPSLATSDIIRKIQSLGGGMRSGA